MDGLNGCALLPRATPGIGDLAWLNPGSSSGVASARGQPGPIGDVDVSDWKY